MLAGDEDRIRITVGVRKNGRMLAEVTGGGTAPA